MTNTSKQVEVIRLELLGMEEYMIQRAEDEADDEQYIKDWWTLNHDFLVYCVDKGMIESFINETGNKWSTWTPTE